MAEYRYIGKDGKPILARDLEDQRDELQVKLTKAIYIATLALNALDEIQTYESPIDPWGEDALTMRELDAFDFHVEFARADLAKLEEQTT